MNEFLEETGLSRPNVHNVSDGTSNYPRPGEESLVVNADGSREYHIPGEDPIKTSAPVIDPEAMNVFPTNPQADAIRRKIDEMPGS